MGKVWLVFVRSGGEAVENLISSFTSGKNLLKVLEEKR
jgi:hypothetical protein